MTTDQDLTNLIEHLRGPAAQSFKYPYASQRPEGTPDIWAVAKPLEEAMNRHPDFAQPFSKFFLGKQIGFFNPQQSVNLLRVAVERGADRAIAWYRRLILTDCTKMRVVAEVEGLWVQESYTFSNGLTLMPVSKLPDSPNSSALKQSTHPLFGIRFPAAIIIELDAVASEDHLLGHDRFIEIGDMIQKTTAAFTLSDEAAPTVGATWAEFVESDLQAGEFGRSWSSSRHDGRVPDHPFQVDQVSLDWVEKYLQLSPDVTSICETPIARLNLARRRVSPGDKAIDGCVCLEALLSGRSGQGELTHKLSVRTALLLGRTLTERQTIAGTVRKFYKLRSKVVHGNLSNDRLVDNSVANEGLSLCLATIRTVIEKAQVPEPEVWDLTGGPNWNRYQES